MAAKKCSVTPLTDKRSRFSVSTASRSASRAPPSTFMARAASGVGRATRARGVRGAAHATAANKLTLAQRARRVSIVLCDAVKYCWKRTANSGAQCSLRNAPKRPSRPEQKLLVCSGFANCQNFMVQKPPSSPRRRPPSTPEDHKQISRPAVRAKPPRGARGVGEAPPQVRRREKSHYKTKLPLAQPRPVGAVARVHVIARLRDRFFVQPVRLV